MKALIIASILFFSLRAMSTELGEDKKSDCPYTNQSNKREAKQVVATDTTVKKEAPKNISK